MGHPTLLPLVFPFLPLFLLSLCTAQTLNSSIAPAALWTTSPLLVGAYYFDGWATGIPIAPLLLTKYSDRRPTWGWRDNTVDIMRQQIDIAANNGIKFWAFDWYYPEGPVKTTPLNNALGLYLMAPNRNRLKFSLMIANHEGFKLGLADWETVTSRWAEYMVHPNYLKVQGGKPMIIFFSPELLLQAAGSVVMLRAGLQTIKDKVRIKSGGRITDVAIGACAGLGSPQSFIDLQNAGFSFLTGYNYNNGWQCGCGSAPFTKLTSDSLAIFKDMARRSALPFVPVITTGWDRRPEEELTNPINMRSIYYTGRTPALVEAAVRMGKTWINQNQRETLADRVLMLYAWNEIGEGGFLTPTLKDKLAYVQAVYRGITR